MDVDSVLFKRRRFRAAKACYPCRRRKVKCDLNHPCASAASTEDSPPARSQPGNDEDAKVAEMAQGLYLDPIRPYNSKVHLGRGSLPDVFSSSNSLASHKDTQTIFELLCLQDSSSTFPFTNLWSPDDGPEVVYDALPSDETIFAHLDFCLLSMFRIMPSIIDIDNLKASLATVFQFRSQSRLCPQDLPSECTPAWFGVLFGILACGVQLASSESRSETMKARVFGERLETIQTLLLLVNFLRNQADASASWAMLGLTIRLAQSLGMHCLPPLDSPVDETEKRRLVIKHSLWRALMWQDALVSLCFGRPPATIPADDALSLYATTSVSQVALSYSEGCYSLFTIGNKISQALMRSRHANGRLSIEEIRDFKTEIYQLESHLAPHIQDYSKCQHFDDYVQHNVYRVLSDSVILCLCRPAVLFQSDEHRQELVDTVLGRCRSVLNTYLELLRLECPTRRSWVYVHAALSCALTLGLATDDKTATANKELLQRFFDGISKGTICANVPSYEIALEQLRIYLHTRSTCFE
ncbi:hypothetical protein NLG97_g207 [Lecanicillium saksenae]|uniref:Uncharacterized protein n=1 Tax=Lecanicillium saksenae TaxID=468837 RepID=A0ACC1R799_9HYPO|nr:hypothetical protein NLG97_g207 [Lecanicillium saksenae]